MVEALQQRRSRASWLEQPSQRGSSASSRDPHDSSTQGPETVEKGQKQDPATSSESSNEEDESDEDSEEESEEEGGDDGRSDSEGARALAAAERRRRRSDDVRGNRCMHLTVHYLPSDGKNNN